ncbi:MAG: molybdopterin-dependent oxidoreductase [Paracoccaceae bacterium]
MNERFSFDATTRKIVVQVGKVEIGQHIHKAFQRIVADVLQVNPDFVSIASVSTSASPNDGLTVGSQSVQMTGRLLRSAAFDLRNAMTEQACSVLKVSSSDLNFNGALLEFSAQNQRCSIFGLPLAQIMEAVPDTGPIDTFRPFSGLIRGAVPFIQDLIFPNMLHARALRGRRVEMELDEDVSILTDGGFAALFAPSQAVLDRAWNCVSSDETPRGAGCDGPIKDWICERKFLTTTSGDFAEINSTINIQASRPFLIHGSIGPSCGIARFSNGVLEVWTHSQGIFQLRDAIAAQVDLDIDNVVAYHVPSSGCYGHNGADDAVMDAVLVCLQNEDRAVRVVWPRHDEFLHGPVGAPMQVQVQAELSEDGAIRSWRQNIWSAPHGQRPGGGGNVNLLASIERDPTLATSIFTDLPDVVGGGALRNAVPPYEVGSLGLALHLAQDLPVRTSSIRGLGTQVNVIAIEAAIDAMAQKCAMDPLTFRLKHITDPRGVAVVKKLRDILSHAPDLEDDEVIAVAYSRYKLKAAYAAVGIRIRLSHDIELLDVWSVVDAGHVVDMSGALNQIEGGIIQAASWTLCEGVLLRNGYIDAKSLAEYPTLGWADIPQIHVHLIEAGPNVPSLGVGECMVGPVSAAIVNAVSSLAGQTIAELPLNRERLISAFAES